jgi:RNA polymerase sigma-B factor
VSIDAPAGAPAARDSTWLLRRYHAERRAEDLDLLVRRFRPLARKLALRYARGSDPVDDLEQIACLGLIKALDRFDPDRGFAFTSFAVPTILGELKRSFRDTAWSAHVPRALQERVAEVRKATDDFAAYTGRAPTVAELTARTGSSPEDIVEALQAAAALSPLSLDAPRGGAEDEDDAAFLDRLGGEDDGYVYVEDRAAIQAALPSLTEIQRQVLELRFSEELKQSEIALRLGVSQMQVSRRLRRSLEQLRESAADTADLAADLAAA